MLPLSLSCLSQVEENKASELEARHKQVQEYADSLEQRLADSEVMQEETQMITEKLIEEKGEVEAQLSKLSRERELLLQELEAAKRQALESAERSQADWMKQLDEAKYDMFKLLMDKFEVERATLEKAHHHTQQLLSQAAKVMNNFRYYIIM